jgi:hypothetical protein
LLKLWKAALPPSVLAAIAEVVPTGVVWLREEGPKRDKKRQVKTRHLAMLDKKRNESLELGAQLI